MTGSTTEPAPGEPCPGCQEVIFQDSRYVHKPSGRVTCGWCGYDPSTGEKGVLTPASGSEDADVREQVTRSPNTARTIDELLALLQEARAAHGGDALVLMNKERLGSPVSLQSVVARSLQVGKDSSAAHRRRVVGGWREISYGWDHDTPSDQFDPSFDPVRRAAEDDPSAAPAVLLF